MVQQKFEQDCTAAGIARTRQSVESTAATQMAHVRELVGAASDTMDEVPGCRANGTCGRCVEFIQSGEGDRTLCARKLRVGRRSTGDGSYASFIAARSGA